MTLFCNGFTGVRSTPKVALQRPPQKKLNKGLQFDFDRAIIIYQTRPYSSAG